MFQSRRLKTGEVGGALANRQEEFRYRTGLTQTTAIKVMAPAERDHAPLAEKAVKLELFERKRGKLIKQRLLFLTRDDLRRVAHTFR